jgi:hypothetical protein
MFPKRLEMSVFERELGAPSDPLRCGLGSRSLLSWAGSDHRALMCQSLGQG